MESKSKFPLWLALVIYVWLCIMVFVVVVGYFTPVAEITPKDYDSYENYHTVYLKAR
jgi:hypothetical protein